jgi:Flp pilus assembly protein TadD
MRPNAFFPFFVIFLTSAFPCLGQASQANLNLQRRVYSISGKVNDDADEHGIDNARVYLKSEGFVLNSAYSSDGGVFEFDGVAPGNYVIEAELEGYDPFTATVTVSRAPVVSFSVGMTKSLAASGAGGDAISAHQLSVPPKIRDVYVKGVDLLQSKGDYKEALVHFQRAIKDFPAYYEAYAMEGVAYISLGDAPLAEAALRKSIDLSAGHYPEPFFLLAGLLNNAGKSADAETAARAAITLNASSWAAHYELAHALYLQTRSEDAEPDALRAHELNPKNPKIVLLVADIHLARRNYTAFLQDIDVYLKLDPTGPDADQVRKDRDQVLQSLQKAPAPPPANHLE